MAWPKGKSRLEKRKLEVAPSTHEQLVAIYLSKFVCSTPGCDYKIHLEDAKNIIEILKKEAE